MIIIKTTRRVSEHITGTPGQTVMHNDWMQAQQQQQQRHQRPIITNAQLNRIL